MKSNIIKIIKEDNDFQKFEVLKRNRNKRHKYGEFIVEGVRNINNALQNQWKINGVIYSSDIKNSEWANEIINNPNIKTKYNLKYDLLQKLSDKENTSEILIVVEMKEEKLINTINKKAPVIALFDRPSNRGNLGTIIRSCDAFGIDGLVISGHSVDLYDPETIAATVGSFFPLPVQRLDSRNEIEDFFREFKEKYKEIQIIGTSAKTDKTVSDIDFNLPTIILIGNESNGLNKFYRETCDIMVKIPIGGSASSLNVACASSIIMYEIQRQRDFNYI